MSRALHAQHHGFKLKPIVERHAVLRQFSWERDHFESAPRDSVRCIKRTNTTITAGQKVLPEMSSKQAGWDGYKIGPIRSRCSDAGKIAWQRNVDEVCVTALMCAIEADNVAIPVPEKSLPGRLFARINRRHKSECRFRELRPFSSFRRVRRCYQRILLRRAARRIDKARIPLHQL